MSSSSSRGTTTMGESSRRSSSGSAGRTASSPDHQEPASVSVPSSCVASNEARKGKKIIQEEPAVEASMSLRSSSGTTMGERSRRNSNGSAAHTTASQPAPPSARNEASEIEEDQEEQQVTHATIDNASSFFPTIKRVPKESRALDDGTTDTTSRYEPCLVPIGPYHRGSSPLSQSHHMLEIEKEECLKVFARIAAAGREGAREVVEAALVEEICRELNSTTARYYDVSWSDRSDHEKEEFARMLLLDGCYLLSHYGEVSKMWQQQQEPALGSTSSSTTTRIENDKLREDETPCSQQLQQKKPASGSSSTSSGDKGANALMARDTWFILENQIPFFVLEKIMHQVIAGCSDGVFTNYAYRLLCKRHRMCIRTEKAPQPIYHLLHLLHTLLLKPLLESESSKTKSSNTTDGGGGGGDGGGGDGGGDNGDNGDDDGDCDELAERQWHRATDYRKYAYVEFKGREIGDSVVTLCSSGPWCCCCCCDSKQQTQGSVLDVRIEGCNVVIPCLRVDGNTWTILLNLMALERQHPDLVGNHVTAYCLFMSQIASTTEDVELLESKGVIDRHLSTPERVAADFSKLCDAVVLNRGSIKTNYLKPIWQQLDKRYNSPWQNVLAWLWLNYFTRRILLGVTVAFILFAAAGISAVYQVLSYYLSKETAQVPPSGGH